MDMYVIEEWWRHNGCWDRQQASGIKYDGSDVYPFLEKTDEWWNSLSNEQKRDAYNEFFSEE